MVSLASALHQAGELNLGGNFGELSGLLLLEGVEKCFRGGIVLEAVEGVELDDGRAGPPGAGDVLDRFEELQDGFDVIEGLGGFAPAHVGLGFLKTGGHGPDHFGDFRQLAGDGRIEAGGAADAVDGTLDDVDCAFLGVDDRLGWDRVIHLERVIDFPAFTFEDEGLGRRRGGGEEREGGEEEGEAHGD